MTPALETIVVGLVLTGAVFYVVRHYWLGRGQACTTSSKGCGDCDATDEAPNALYKTTPLVSIGSEPPQ